jgi:serine/threonine-protein kinase
VAASASPARADSVTAEALFQAGQKLMSEQRYDEACGKFAASMAQDRAVGTHYALADCHEKAGRIATAWAMLLEVESEAMSQQRPDRATFAHSRAEKLAPRLMKVTVTLSAEAQSAGAAVKRDGKAVEAAQLGVPVPVDPGPHTFTATAEGKKEWKSTLDASKEGETYTVQVPKLEDAPHDATPPRPPATQKTSPWKTVGWVLGGAGVVGLGVGTAFGIVAIGNKNDAHCDANKVCDPGTTSGIKSAATASNIGLIAGGVLLAGGAALVLFAPGGKTEAAPAAKTVRLAPVVTPRGGELVVGGSF